MTYDNVDEQPGATESPTASEPVDRRRRTRRALLIALGLMAALVASAFGAVLFFGAKIAGDIERIADPFAAIPTRPPAHGPAEPGTGADPVNILLVGSDSRISAGDPSQWSFGAQRTDAIMILHIPSDRSGAYIVSIPRDSWVDIPERGKAKINAAYSYGGPSLLIQSVEELTGVRIDHLAIADFESFAAITDAVGGVDITVPQGSGGSPAPGTYHMDGEQALAYARERKHLPGGDFDRVRRQQNWIRAIAGGAIDTNTLSDPQQVYSLIRSLSKSVALDSGFGTRDMLALGLSLKGVRANDLTFMTVPTQGTGWSPDGKQSIVILDDAESDALFAAMANDTMSQYVESNEDSLDVLGSVVR